LPVAAGNEMTVDVNCHVYAGVAHLLFHVNEACSAAEKQTGIGVANIVDPDTPKTSFS